MFNSVPIDPTEAELNGQLSKEAKKAKPDDLSEKFRRKMMLDRIKTLLVHLKRFGIPSAYLFEIEDLSELKNVPKVTRCVAMMAKMVSEAFESVSSCI